MKIFIICPVRNATPEEKVELEEYVTKLESDGHDVHYPPRDTDQTDPVGISIIRNNHASLYDSDEVHVYWNGNSIGSLFDIGMLYALHKPLILIKPITSTPHKSFENILLYQYLTRGLSKLRREYVQI